MAPHYFGLEGIDLSPSLYNYGLKNNSYIPVGQYIKVLKDNYLNKESLIKYSPE